MKRVERRCVTKWSVVFIVAALLILKSGTYAADTTWTSPVNGLWTNATGWDNGVPNANAGFLTNATASYTVTFDGGGSSFTNVVISNASVGNTTTLNANSGTLTLTGSQSAGGIILRSNAVFNLNGGVINNASQLSVSEGAVVHISSPAPFLFEDFESYTNGQILATVTSNTVAGSPWGRFGNATAVNPTAFTNQGVSSSTAMRFTMNWTGTNTTLVYWFPSPTNLAFTTGLMLDLRVDTQALSNTIVKIGFEKSDATTTWVTKTAAAPILTNIAFQTYVLNLNSTEMERTAGAGSFDLSAVRTLRIRFENPGLTNSQQVFIDNFQGVPGSVWNQTAGSVAVGDAGDGTMVIGVGGLVTGQANVPTIGRNSTTGSASNGVGRLYVNGGTYLWPGRSGSANGMFVGRGQIGIVTVSNGWFTLSSAAATNGLRVGSFDSTVFSPGYGMLEMYGGVVTNTGFLQPGVGGGASTNFGVGTISVSGGTFYQLGMGGDVRLGFTNSDSGFLSVKNTGVFISTNTVNVGWAPGSSGGVEVSGNGELTITNTASQAVLLVSGNGGTGTVTLSGGTTTVDRLIATNGANSIINFSSGTLNVKNRTIATTGAPITIGDATNVATLSLLAGTHTFNNGLTVSSNATLRGAAVVDGQPVTIASGGILSPGIGVGALTISNDLTISGGVLQYDLGSNSDRTVVSGNLSVTGTLNVSDSGGFTNGIPYVLFTYGSIGTLTVNIGSLPAGFSGAVSNDVVNSRVVLNVTTGAPPLDPFAQWQFQYFGSTNCALCGSVADVDGDGISNTNEFLAGTNPTNSASALQIISTVRNGNSLVVTWGTAGGKTNIVQASAGRVDGSYTNDFVDIVASWTVVSGSGDTTTNYVDGGALTNAPARYYRVRLVP